jgi:CRP-like cAMP-binding protein
LIEFDWRCAVLEDRYGNIILIPNGEFSQTRIRNLSRPVARHRLSAQIEVAIEHDHVQVCNILANACAHVVAKGQILANPPPEVRLREVAEGVARFDLWFFIAPGTSQSSTRHAVLDAGIGFLKAAGVPLKRHEHHTLGPADAEDLLQADVRGRILRQVPFFDILDAPQIALMAERTRPRRMLSDEILLSAGGAGESMFVVLQGRLGVQIEVDGKALGVTTLWPRDILGGMSLFTGAPRSATVLAHGPATVLEIGKPLMAELLALDAGLAAAFARLIVARQSANRKAVEDGRNPVVVAEEEQRSMLDRVAKFFGLGRLMAGRPGSGDLA